MDDNIIVGREIKMLSNLLIRELDSTLIKQGLDRVTAINSWILGYLSHNSDRLIYQRDIEREFSIARSTVTTLVKLMEKKGLIERSDVESDARLKSLKLTDKGREIHDLAHIGLLETEAKLCQNITHEELENFIFTARKMRRNMNCKCECEKGEEL